MSRRQRNYRLGYKPTRLEKALKAVSETVSGTAYDISEITREVAGRIKQRYQAIDNQVIVMESRQKKMPDDNSTMIDLFFSKPLPALTPDRYNLLFKLKMAVTVNDAHVRVYIPEGESFDLRRLAMDICKAVGWVLQDFTAPVDSNAPLTASADA